jgi:hypothetical protein
MNLVSFILFTFTFSVFTAELQRLPVENTFNKLIDFGNIKNTFSTL